MSQDIDRTENEENITLEIDGETFRISSVDITIENEGEEFYGADEYEILYDVMGRPMPVPKGPRKLQGISIDRVASGTIRGVGKKPNVPHNGYGVPDLVDATLQMESHDIDLPDTIFTRAEPRGGEWAFDFVSDLED